LSFDGRATSERHFGAQFYFEDLFHYPVDLVTDTALRPELLPGAEREASVSMATPAEPGGSTSTT